MLEQVLRHMNNWFLVPDGVHAGTYSIKDGGISLPFLVDGQYFRIIGSVFNDGMHKYGEPLIDETFTGEIWALAVPRAVISLSDEIREWIEKYGNAAYSPFQSESFAGYSYTKSTNGNSEGGSPDGWQSVFRSRLNQWRKI